MSREIFTKKRKAILRMKNNSDFFDDDNVEDDELEWQAMQFLGNRDKRRMGEEDSRIKKINREIKKDFGQKQTEKSKIYRNERIKQ